MEAWEDIAIYLASQLSPALPGWEISAATYHPKMDCHVVIEPRPSRLGDGIASPTRDPSGVS